MTSDHDQVGADFLGHVMDFGLGSAHYQVTIALRNIEPVSYTHLRAHETVLDLVCRLLLEKKKKKHAPPDLRSTLQYKNT